MVLWYVVARLLFLSEQSATLSTLPDICIPGRTARTTYMITINVVELISSIACVVVSLYQSRDSVAPHFVRALSD